MVKKDILVLPVPGVLQDLMGTTVLRDPLDHRVSKAEKVNKALLVLQASRVCQALQEQLVKSANPEKGVSLVNLVSLVLLVQEASVVPQVKVELLDLPGLSEAEVLLDPQGLMETRVNPVWLVLLAMLVRLVRVDFQERGVPQVCLEARAKRERLAPEAKSATQAETARVALLVL